MHARVPAMLSFALWLATGGCAAPAEHDDSELGAAQPAPRLVSGRAEYEDRLFDDGGFTGELRLRPVRGGVVTLRSPSGRIVTSGRTDERGRFALTAPRIPDLVVVLSPRVTLGNRTAEVTDHGGDAAPFELSTVAGEETHLIARAAEYGGAYNVLDQVYRALRAIAGPEKSAPATLPIRWERGRPHPCGSCFVGGAIRLGGQDEDPDEYDDDIVLHEVAHWIVALHRADDSPAGPHRDRRVSPTLAWGEAVAYFFAAMVTADPIIVDNYRTSTRVIDIERMLQGGASSETFFGTATGHFDGALREEIPAGILWDAFDPTSPEEPFDRIELGAERQLDVLLRALPQRTRDRGARGLDLVDYLDYLACHVADPDAVTALARARSFPWIPPACDAPPP